MVVPKICFLRGGTGSTKFNFKDHAQNLTNLARVAENRAARQRRWQEVRKLAGSKDFYIFSFFSKSSYRKTGNIQKERENGPYLPNFHSSLNQVREKRFSQS